MTCADRELSGDLSGPHDRRRIARLPRESEHHHRGGGGGSGSSNGNPEESVQSTAEADNRDAVNAVSLLQELIQGYSSFLPHTKILNWHFEQQMENDTSLQFRATVCFVVGAVPHSFSGGWQSAKKKAQRDTANRVRGYLTRQPDTVSTHAALTPSSLPEDVQHELEAHCNGTWQQEYDAHNTNLEWAIEDVPPAAMGTPGKFRCTVTFNLKQDSQHFVPAHFAGSWNTSAQAAKIDCAERVLWYFGHTQLPKKYDPIETTSPPCAPSAATPPVMAPSTLNGVPSILSTLQPKLDDKTILMHVQNSLQKEFAKDTEPGQSVWEWGYEKSSDPQIFRAHVSVPCWNNKTFRGEWCKGKKLAQRSACLIVKQHLEKISQQR